MATVLTGQLMVSTTPVVNATVTWSVQGSGTPPSPANTATTDAGGVFAFEIPIAATTNVQISVNANLYNPVQINNIQLTPGGKTVLTIGNAYLVPKASSEFGAVAGTVQNISGLPIPNATVSILGAGDLFATTTDSNGNYQLANVGFNSNLTLQAAKYRRSSISPRMDDRCGTRFMPCPRHQERQHSVISRSRSGRETTILEPTPRSTASLIFPMVISR